MNLDKIQIQGLNVDCIIGILPDERTNAQPVVVDITAWLDTREAARSCMLQLSLDYAQLTNDMAFILESGKFLLLETAASALCHYVLAHELVAQCSVKIAKPKALDGKAVPAVEITRTGDEAHIDTLSEGEWLAGTVFESRDALVMLFNATSPDPEEPDQVGLIGRVADRQIREQPKAILRVVDRELPSDA